MWFLIKGTFWFAAVLVVLSYVGPPPSTDNQAASAIEVASAFSAATEAYQYVSALCSEKPDVCEKGAETFAALGVRAKDGARVAFDILDKQFGDGRSSVTDTETAVLSDPEPTPFPAEAAAAASDTIFTGTVPVPQKRPAH